MAVDTKLEHRLYKTTTSTNLALCLLSHSPCLPSNAGQDNLVATQFGGFRSSRNAAHFVLQPGIKASCGSIL